MKATGICDTCGQKLPLTPGGRVVTHSDPHVKGYECKGSRCLPEPGTAIKP